MKIFSALILVQLLLWGAAHFYLTANKPISLIVADTSYSMKENFPQVKRWIENYESNSRYSTILIGTDKASLGRLDELHSKEVIFRTAFGKLTNENLIRLYSHVAADKRLLLSDGSLQPDDWDVIEF